MRITPREKELLDFVVKFKKHNAKLGISSITQAQIAEKFGMTKQAINNHGKYLENKGLITRARGRSSCFWELN